MESDRVSDQAITFEFRRKNSTRQATLCKNAAAGRSTCGQLTTQYFVIESSIGDDTIESHGKGSQR